MDEVKDKGKVIMKKLNNLFSSPAKFKGEGQKLGSASDVSASASKASNIHGRSRNSYSHESRQQQEERRRIQQERWERERQTSTLQPGSDANRGKTPVDGSHTRDADIDYAGSDANRWQNPVSGSQRRDVAIDFGDSDVNRVHIPVHGSQRNGMVTDSSSSVANKQQYSVLLGMAPEITQIEASEGGFRDNAIKSICESTQVQDFEGDASVAAVSNIDCSFDPFAPSIASRKEMHQSALVFECPICKMQWNSEIEVSSHIDDCLGVPNSMREGDQEVPEQSQNQVESPIDVLFAGGPSIETLSVLSRLLRNVVNDPSSEKYRRIRMSNPKIHETIGTALGGVGLLESLGFHLKAEGNEVWAIMDLPSAGQINVIKDVIVKLDGQLSQPPGSVASGRTKENQTRNLLRDIDRKLRVFHAAPENLASKIELPDSFFELSAAEVRQEALSRRQKLEESQQLIPKTFKEKQAAANKRRYKSCIIRIQFPDGIILQGLFLADELTTALYEFVSSALEDSSLEFDLVFIASPKNHVIPSTGAATPTLEQANLVPTAIVKFRPVQNMPNVCPLLRADLLQLSEPLTSIALSN